MTTTTEAERGLTPISASDLLRALDAAPDAAEPTAWEAPSAAPIPDSVLYEPLDLPRYTATELAAACARTAEALQAQHAAQRQADTLHPPIQVTPYRGAHIQRERPEPLWPVMVTIFLAAAIGLGATGNVGGAAVAVVAGALAFVLTRGERR